MKNISDLPISGSIEEYTSLRNEVIERLSFMNSQASSAFGVILTVWAAGFTCIGIMAADWSNLSYSYMRWLSLCPIGAFFISMLIILPMAIKSGENVRQIIAIGVFIRVFYEYIPSLRNSDNHNTGWETANMLVNRGITQKKSKKKFFSWFNGQINDRLNSEYTLLCLASCFFMGISIMINYEVVRNSDRIVFYIIGYVFCGLFALFWLPIISYQSNGKRNAKIMSASYTKEFLILAVEKKIISKKELKKAREDLNPKNEVNNSLLESYFE